MYKRLFTSLAFFCVFFTSGTHAETFKIATLSPEGSFWTNTMKQAADTIAVKTASRVQFRFYPGGVMGNDKAVQKKIRIGQLHGGLFSIGSMADLAPDTQIYMMPLLFKTYAEVDYVRKNMDADLEQAITNTGMVNFGLADGGFGYIMSKKSIADADDLKKYKVWTPSDDAAAKSASKTFQLTPVPLSIGDVLTGLQTDLIDTITASPIAAIALQWHSQIKYVTDLPIAYFTVFFGIDKKAWAKISVEDQKIVRELLHAAFVKIDQQNRSDNTRAFEALKKQGIQIITPNTAQLQKWHDKTGMATGIFVNEAHISQKAQDRIHGLLSDYRKNPGHAQ